MPVNVSNLSPEDEDSNLFYNSLNFLGAPSESKLPGTLSLPEGGGPPALPSAPGVSGAAGTGASPTGEAAATGAGPGGSGAREEGSPLAIVAKALGIGSDVLQKLLSLSPDLGTRGTFGGEGTEQNSNQSLSDQLRSLTGEGLTGGSPGSIAASNQLVNDYLAGTGQETLPDIKSLVEGTSGFGGAPSAGALGELGINTALQTIPGLGSGLPPLGSALSTPPPESLGALEGGVPGGGNITAGGVNLIGSALGGLASLSGSEGLGKAASIVGGIPAAATILSAIPALSSGALTALSANPYTAAVAAAITQVLDLVNSLEQNYSGEHTFLKGLTAPIPVVGSILGEQIDKGFLPSEAWRNFPSEVTQTAGAESRALDALMKGLPYVQSQQELANLLSAYKGVVGQRVGGYGEGSATYDLPALPEVGARTHGMHTTPTNFEAITPEVQAAINALLPTLPATYQGPAGDDPLMRTWTQFMDPRGNGEYSGAAPVQFRVSDPWLNVPLLNQQTPYTNRLYIYDANAPSGEGTPIMYGSEGYDYAASGFPAPGQRMGSVSPYWTQLTTRATQPASESRQAAAPAAAAPSNEVTEALRALLLGTPGKGPASIAGEPGAPSLGGSEDLTEAIRRRLSGIS